MCGQRPYAIELYETPQGDKPVLRWIKEDLSVSQRRACGGHAREALPPPAVDEERLVALALGRDGQRLATNVYPGRLATSPPGYRCHLVAASWSA